MICLCTLHLHAYSLNLIKGYVKGYGVQFVSADRFCKLLLSTQTAWLAGAIFAVHPIHTEAVAGIVGRAEVRISYMFYILLKGSCIDVNGGG